MNGVIIVLSRNQRGPQEASAGTSDANPEGLLRSNAMDETVDKTVISDGVAVLFILLFFTLMALLSGAVIEFLFWSRGVAPLDYKIFNWLGVLEGGIKIFFWGLMITMARSRTPVFLKIPALALTNLFIVFLFILFTRDLSLRYDTPIFVDIHEPTLRHVIDYCLDTAVRDLTFGFYDATGYVQYVATPNNENTVFFFANILTKISLSIGAISIPYSFLLPLFRRSSSNSADSIDVLDM